MVVYESVRDQGFLVKKDTQIMRAEVADPGHSSITMQLFVQDIMLGYSLCKIHTQKPTKRVVGMWL